MNDHNPYAPPVSQVADAASPPSAIRKPVSVWLLQIVCGVMLLLILSSLSTTFTSWKTAPSGIARYAGLVAVLLTLLVASLLAWTIIAAQRRSQFGRWLGVIVMGSVFASVMFGVVSARLYGQIPLSALGDFYGIAALLAVPSALLLYLPAFSKRARAWYGKT